MTQITRVRKRHRVSKGPQESQALRASLLTMLTAEQVHKVMRKTSSPGKPPAAAQRASQLPRSGMSTSPPSGRHAATYWW